MENNEKKESLLTIVSKIFFILLLVIIPFIAIKFMSLNSSLEYERSVFISQIAEQMKNNVMLSGENHMTNTRNFAAVIEEVRPKTFEHLERLFPEYVENKEVNRLFFLSSDCELYDIYGVKQWASFSYDDYLINVLSNPNTVDFIRIGMNQEFMVYSVLLSAPVEIDGHKISAVLYGWDSSEYRAILSSRLFEEKSSSLLVGKNGNIAIYPEDEDSESYGYNVFTYLKKQGMSENDLEIIREMIAGKEDKTAFCEANGNRWLLSSSYYTEQYRIFIMLPLQITSADTYYNLYTLIACVVMSLFFLFLILGSVLFSATLRQKAQREKELQAELLMKTAQAKNEFLAKMSHDIRTPLNGIIGMNYIAFSKASSECTEVVECLKKVDIAAKYLLGILNDILDMGKIESGEVCLSSTPFSLYSLVDDIKSLIDFQMEGKNFDFIVDIPQSVDFDYIGDELRLKQILINLLSNAVKFTQKGSVTLIVKIEPFELNSDKVVFYVQDTGKGMSQKFMEHIFTPFTQEDDTIASNYGGSGLGLSIAKSFVDLMGGTISVTSEVGKGSEFIVTIIFEKTDRVKVVSKSAKEETKKTYDFAGKRLLLCEDNDLNAEIAEIIFKDFNLEVDRAENGEVGMEMFKQSELWYYDMIFMDVRMPKMDGYQATRAIRTLKRPDSMQVPICALSANAFYDDIKKSIEAGMNEHLAKPLNVVELIDVLKKYLEKTD